MPGKATVVDFWVTSCKPCLDMIPALEALWREHGLACEACPERRLVAFSCKGGAFWPSCLGRRMAQGAANLVDHVLPREPLRQ